ncbi:UDP-glucose 4-epimerase, partial [Acinetobacter baumannii]
LDSSKEQLAFISNENYQVAETEMMATKMGIADLINTTPYFSHWIDRLVLTRLGNMQVATPSRFSYQSRYWTKTYIKQSLGSE